MTITLGSTRRTPRSPAPADVALHLEGRTMRVLVQGPLDRRARVTLEHAGAALRPLRDCFDDVVVDLTQVTSFPLLGALFLAECCDLAAVGGAGVRVVGASAEARQVLRECRLDDLVADAGPRPA